MRELLLAYLFGQLDNDQRERVERALADEPELQKELRRLQVCLGVDAPDAREVVEPPPDLVERTCSRIVSFSRPGAAEDSDLQPCLSMDRDPAVGAATAASGAWQPIGGGQYSRGDLAVALGLSLVAAMLLFPAMHDSRVMARRTACQNNMRSILLGISTYADANGGLIPHVPAEGKESFAGIFAVILGEFHFIDPQELPQLLVCPGRVQVRDWEREAVLFGLPIPTRDQLLASPDELLTVLQRRVGGDFAYRLGYIDEWDRYRRWRIDYSSRSAILADAPSPFREFFQSENHGGRGQNVAFADGHVTFVCDCPEVDCGDKLFMNRHGYRAAGLDPIDNVLVPSEVGPSLPLIDASLEWGRTPR